MRYDLMVEGALRGVVRATLDQIAETGLPGDHHLYITFLTEEPGVEIPDHLRERYPHEMTIVLQHQFWDLITDDIAFSIKLSFNDVPETLRVPFAALTAFADPSVNFGLQFKFQHADDAPDTDETESADQASTDLATRANTALIALTPSDDGAPIAEIGNNSEAAESEESPATTDSDEDSDASNDTPQPIDNVVALDTFRKK
ncbi:MAG: hypothetical protein JKY20_04595 [Alphaproteobacteria bacterium]|nr:hypothetical protein [Alphaproteobacteria bacterium]